MISDLMERDRYEDSREDFVETGHPDLDLLIPLFIIQDLKKL